MRSNMMLLMAAAIWGWASWPSGSGWTWDRHLQRPALSVGAASLLPLLWWLKSRQPTAQPGDRRLLLTGGLIAGTVLFSAASLQQVGLLYTTAAKAVSSPVSTSYWCR